MKSLACFLLAVVAVSAQAQITVPNPTRTDDVPSDLPVELVAYLYGANVVPPSGVQGTGIGAFSLDGDTLQYSIQIEHGSLVPTIGGVFGPANRGMNGGLILALEPFVFQRNTPNSPGPVGWYVSSGEISVSGGQSDQIRAGLWYVMVFSEVALDAVIRGQLCPLTPDSDCDYDGVSNEEDEYPNTPPGVAVDSAGASIEQLCPCHGTVPTETGRLQALWKNHAAYVECVATQAARFFRQRIINAKELRRIIKVARESDCGKPLPPPIFGGALSPDLQKRRPKEGIFGRSTFFVCPVAGPGAPCMAFPFPTTLTVIEHKKNKMEVLGDVATDGSGNFVLGLKPSIYTLVPWVEMPPEDASEFPPPLIPIPIALPVTVEVKKKGVAEVTIIYENRWPQ